LKNKNSFIPILLAVVSVNGLGILLKYLDLNSFIILLGFRFHLALVLPFLFVMHLLGTTKFRNEFIDPFYKKNYPYVLSLLLIPSIIFAVLYYIEYINLGDPEYFYEFGLSSLVDLPIYIVWNAPQLLMFYFFLLYAAERKKLKLPVILFAAVLPFAYEFIPLQEGEYDLFGIFTLIITGILTVPLLLRYRNIYWFTIFFFLLFWISILLFGSGSSVLVKIIFASQYSSWEGFFEVNKSIKDYLVPAYVLSAAVMLLFLVLFGKREKAIS